MLDSMEATSLCRYALTGTSLQRVPTRTGRPLLLLDVDETLVYSRTTIARETSTLRRRNSTGNAGSGVCAFMPGRHCMEATFKLVVGTKIITVHSQKRPFCDMFLRTMGRKFDIGLFTSSYGPYAEAIANWLDADRNIIQYVFHRDHCVWEKDRPVKDLEFIGCDLKTTIMIDNSPAGITKQPKNGLPCKSFYGDRHDTELRKLTNLLIGVSTTSGDVRQQLAIVKHELCILRQLRRTRASTDVAAEALCLPHDPTVHELLDSWL